SGNGNLISQRFIYILSLVRCSSTQISGQDKRRYMSQHLIRHFIMLVAFLVLASLPTLAQNYPGAEVSGGFSYLRTEGGGNLYGWDASVAGNLNRWFGLVGEFSGHYGTGFDNGGFAILVPGAVTSIDTDSNVYTFLFGPRFSYRKDRPLTPYGHVLPGFARSSVSVNVITTAATFHSSATSTAFAMALGGGVDLRLSRSVAFRMIQADYLLTRFGGITQNNAGIPTGLVSRF